MTDKQNTHSPGSRGLTLFEIIMVLVIMGVIAAFAGGPLVHTLDLWLNKTRGHTDRAELHFALERMSREVRVAKNVVCKNDSNNDSMRVVIPPPKKYESKDNELLLDGDVIFRTNRPEETLFFSCNDNSNSNFVALRLSIQEQGEDVYSIETRIYQRN